MHGMPTFFKTEVLHLVSNIQLVIKGFYCKMNGKIALPCSSIQ